MSNILTNIVPKHVLRQTQLETFELVAKSLESAFGPFASTTAIRRAEDQEGKANKAAGVTEYTKDGHTILKSILVRRPIELTTIENLIDVTSETVKKVGDGTTSAIELSYIIFAALQEASVKFGIADQDLVKDLQDTAKEIIKRISNAGHEATLQDIFEIAMISTNGNVEISDAIMQIYQKHGMGVHIDLGVSNTENHEIKEYDGMTFDQGYYNEVFINNAAKSTAEIHNPKIYIFEDAVDTPEMRQFFDKIIDNNVFGPLGAMMQLDQLRQDPAQYNELLGNLGGKMPEIIPTVILSSGYGTDMRSRADDMFDVLARYPIDRRPPILSITNIHDLTALHDLATLSGAKIIKKYNNSNTMKADQEAGLAPTVDNVCSFGGSAELVIADNTKSKIINPAKMYEKDEEGKTVLDENNNPIYSGVYSTLINTCESQLKNMEVSKKDITDIYLMKKRINSLKGNLVEYLIGGISIADRDAVKSYVEDAILNCRSAAEEGVGYGANYEAFRAVYGMLYEYEKEHGKIGDNEYSMIKILFNAYMTLTDMLYKTAFGGDVMAANVATVQSLIEGKPCNLKALTVHSLADFKFDDTDQKKVTATNTHDAFDGHVLSSIKSDQVILNAITKIIGLTFATNQYFTQSPETNIYYQASLADEPPVVCGVQETSAK